MRSCSRKLIETGYTKSYTVGFAQWQTVVITVPVVRLSIIMYCNGTVRTPVPVITVQQNAGDCFIKYPDSDRVRVMFLVLCYTGMLLYSAQCTVSEVVTVTRWLYLLSGTRTVRYVGLIERAGAALRSLSECYSNTYLAVFDERIKLSAVIEIRASSGQFAYEQQQQQGIDRDRLVNDAYRDGHGIVQQSGVVVGTRDNRKLKFEPVLFVRTI
jgi:hypothetical protein